MRLCCKSATRQLESGCVAGDDWPVSPASSMAGLWWRPGRCGVVPMACRCRQISCSALAGSYFLWDSPTAGSRLCRFPKLLSRCLFKLGSEPSQKRLGSPSAACSSGEMSTGCHMASRPAGRFPREMSSCWETALPPVVTAASGARFRLRQLSAGWWPLLKLQRRGQSRSASCSTVRESA